MLGHLDPVDSMNITERNNIITLTWEPPFTLDIPSEDPDIRGYCVDIFNSTSNMLIYSECGIITTLFQFTPKDTVCHNYTFTIIPVNVVGNGTNNTVLYYGVDSSKCSESFAG